MELREAIRKRHSTRSFKTSKAKLRDVFGIVESALHAPMAGNVCTLKIILVEDADQLKEITEAAVDNSFVGEASHIIVVCSDLKQAENLYGEKGSLYNAQQAGAAIENMLLTTEDLGLATCWVGSFDDAAVKRSLEIKDDSIRIEAILPIGYGVKSPDKQRKTSFKQVVRYNKFKIKKQEFYTDFYREKIIS